MLKKLLVFVLIVNTQVLIGQESKFKIDHYAINVADLNKSVDFYQDLFSLNEIFDGTEQDHIKWFRISDEQELHIIQVENLDLKLIKGVHIALTTNNLAAFIEKLNNKKIDYFDWPGNKNKVSLRPDSVQQIYFQDPDGYWIEINDNEKMYKIKK